MTTAYIKFIHKDDVYAINPSYDLRPPGDDFVAPKICSRCGDTLYIPIELSEDINFTVPLPDVYRPFPKEIPYLFIKESPQFPTLAVSRAIPVWEEHRLRDFSSMTSVDSNGFAMLIEDVSRQPVEHKCEYQIRGLKLRFDDCK